jgi:hypothetical protein
MLGKCNMKDSKLLTPEDEIIKYRIANKTRKKLTEKEHKRKLKRLNLKKK